MCLSECQIGTCFDFCFFSIFVKDNKFIQRLQRLLMVGCFFLLVVVVVIFLLVVFFLFFFWLVCWLVFCLFVCFCAFFTQTSYFFETINCSCPNSSLQLFLTYSFLLQPYEIFESLQYYSGFN